MNGSLSSSIGRKLIVAATGVALIGFVLAHLAGNLQVFRGQDALDGYAEGLRRLGPLLWALRFGLLALAVAHVVLTLQLAAANRAARGSRYAVTRSVQATPAARSMLVTGVMLLLFVIYHLAHFTWGRAHPEFSGRLDPAGRPDVYSMLVGSFGRPWIAAPYVVAMVLLGLHLSHGVSSVFQTLGWRGPRTEKLVARLGPTLGAIVAAGYISIPLAVQMGVIGLPPGVTFP